MVYKISNSNKKWKDTHDFILDVQLGLVDSKIEDLLKIASGKKYSELVRLECILAIYKFHKLDILKFDEILYDIEDNLMKKSYRIILNYIIDQDNKEFLNVVKYIKNADNISFHIFTERFSIFLTYFHQLIFFYILKSLKNQCDNDSKLESIELAIDNLNSLDGASYLEVLNYEEWLKI